ncbi:uncharacterized protein KY384_003547 [Bacidia gigantensis]|uniref:uncharacterized protein n=1 Tax=Bacidia gigantensis TaxID=2732470 RepID=UPI001D0512C2|nr:uncharacterized protein KY384_003547 [Bacidia gigantensis]KAG8531911.1 hypothetical protein KY384_003547 [Bacidia gigantensis]
MPLSEMQSAHMGVLSHGYHGGGGVSCFEVVSRLWDHRPGREQPQKDRRAKRVEHKRLKREARRQQEEETEQRHKEAGKESLVRGKERHARLHARQALQQAEQQHTFTDDSARLTFLEHAYAAAMESFTSHDDIETPHNRSNASFKQLTPAASDPNEDLPLYREVFHPPPYWHHCQPALALHRPTVCEQGDLIWLYDGGTWQVARVL